MKTKREAIMFIAFGVIIGFLGAMLYIRTDDEIIWSGFQGMGIGLIVTGIVYMFKNKGTI